MYSCIEYQAIKAEKSYIDEFILIGFPNIRATKSKKENERNLQKK